MEVYDQAQEAQDEELLYGNTSGVDVCSKQKRVGISRVRHQASSHLDEECNNVQADENHTHSSCPDEADFAVRKEIVQHATENKIIECVDPERREKEQYHTRKGEGVGRELVLGRADAEAEGESLPRSCHDYRPT